MCITLELSFPQFEIKCKEIHKLDISFHKMALRYILMELITADRLINTNER